MLNECAAFALVERMFRGYNSACGHFEQSKNHKTILPVQNTGNNRLMQVAIHSPR